MSETPLEKVLRLSVFTVRGYHRLLHGRAQNVRPHSETRTHGYIPPADWKKGQQKWLHHGLYHGKFTSPREIEFHGVPDVGDRVSDHPTSGPGKVWSVGSVGDTVEIMHDSGSMAKYHYHVRPWDAPDQD